MKKIYLIRHAESEANAANDLDNPKYYYDAKITKKGVKQAHKASAKLKNINFDLFISSPLTRALQTFSIIFPGKKPIISSLIREHLYHSCDVGRQPLALKKEFPKFNFTSLDNYWWNNNKKIDLRKINQESRDDIKIRLDSFKNWINLKNHKTIAVVSHGTFLSQVTERMLDNCEHFIWKY